MTERPLESAVADHLRGEKARGAHVSRKRPAFDSYTARLPVDADRVVIAYFGVQCPLAQRDSAFEAAGEFASAMSGPVHREFAEYVDEWGFLTVLVVAYWLDIPAFDAWFESAGRDWTATKVTGLGHFTEIMRPSTRRLETLYSSDRQLQGVGAVADSVSAPIAEHGYWGGMRDRLPDSGASDLAPHGQPVIEDLGDRLRVAPHHNACLIRSGQDFSMTTAEERVFYLERVEPRLRRGMEFLRDDGASAGCYANRYVTVLDGAGNHTEKTFAMSWWNDLADLERWARSHPTHAEIFAAFNAHMMEFGQDAQLRLYHEVMVVPKSDQFFEYRNCHEHTGMLRSQLLTQGP